MVNVAPGGPVMMMTYTKEQGTYNFEFCPIHKPKMDPKQDQRRSKYRFRVCKWAFPCTVHDVNKRSIVSSMKQWWYIDSVKPIPYNKWLDRMKKKKINGQKKSTNLRFWAKERGDHLQSCNNIPEPGKMSLCGSAYNITFESTSWQSIFKTHRSKTTCRIHYEVSDQFRQDWCSFIFIKVRFCTSHY